MHEDWTNAEFSTVGFAFGHVNARIAKQLTSKHTDIVVKGPAYNSDDEDNKQEVQGEHAQK